MAMKKTLRLLALSAAALAIVGCSTFENADRMTRKIEGTEEDVTRIARQIQNRQQTPPRPTVAFHQGSWASLVPLEIKQREARDGLRCRGEKEMAYGPRTPVDVLEFGQFITNLCGVPVRVTTDAVTAIQTQGRATMGVGAMGAAGSIGAATPPVPTTAIPQQMLVNSGQVPAAIPMGAGQPGPMVGGRAGLIDIKYKGDLPGLFDMVTSRLGLSWRYTDGTVSIFYLDTRTFRLFSQPYNYDLQSVVQSGTTTSIGSGGASGGSGGSGGSSSGIGGSGSTQQSTTITAKANRWDDIDRVVKSMLTPGVGRASSSSSTGTITVTDTGEVLERVNRYIENENKSLAKQVIFNVKVLSVTLTDGDSLGIDWTLVYKSLNGNFGFNLANVTTKAAGAISATASVLTTATGNAQQFAGTSLVMNALAQQGRVSELLSPSVTTLNHQTVPVQVGQQVSYVATAQTTQTPNVGSSVSLTPGTVTTGFNMRLTPYVMPDNVMLLDAALNVSALRRIRSVTSAGTTIEVPEVDNRIFSQQARMRPGETLILSGFERVSESAERNGVGNPNNILFGGSVNSSRTRDVIVVLITPILMD